MPPTPEEMQAFFDSQSGNTGPIARPFPVSDVTAGPPELSNSDLAQYGIGSVTDPRAALASGEGGTFSHNAYEGITDAVMGRNRGPERVMNPATGQMEDVPGGSYGPPQAPAKAELSPQEIADARANQAQLMAPRPQFVPGGWRKDFLPFQPQTMAMQDAAIEGHLAANEQMVQASSKQAQALDAFHSQQAAMAEARQAQAYEKQQAREIQYKQAAQKYQDFVEDAGSGKIDPNRYWRNNGAAGNFALAIGSALGGWVNAKTGAPNAVLDRIHRAISADIAGQEHDIATNKWKAGAQMNMLGELRAQGMDDMTSRNALESAQWRIAEEHLKAIMPRTEDPIMQARFAGAAAGIEDKRVELAKQADNYMFQRPHYVGGVTGASQKEDNKLFVPTGPGGAGYFARTDKEAEEARALEVAAATLVPQIDAAIKTYDDTWFGSRAISPVINTENVSRLKSLGGKITLGVKNLEKGGALDKGMQDLTGDIQGDWTGVAKAPVAAARELKSYILNKQEAMRRSQGGQAARQVIYQTPQGSVRSGATGMPEFSSPGTKSMPGTKIGP